MANLFRLKIILLFLFFSLNLQGQIQWISIPNPSVGFSQHTNSVAISSDTILISRTALGFPHYFKTISLDPNGQQFHDTTGSWNNYLTGTDARKVVATSDGFFASYLEDQSTFSESDIYVKFNTDGTFSWMTGNDSTGIYIDISVNNDTIYTLSFDTFSIACKMYDLNGSLLSNMYVDTPGVNTGCRPSNMEINNNRIYVYGFFQDATLPGIDKQYLTICNKDGVQLKKLMDSTGTRERIIDIDFLEDNNFVVLSAEDYSTTYTSVILTLFDSAFQLQWCDTLPLPFNSGQAGSVHVLGTEIVTSVTSGARKFALFSTDLLNGNSQLIFQDDSLKSSTDLLTEKFAGGVLMSGSQALSGGTMFRFYYYKNGNFMNFDNYLDTYNGNNLFLEVSDSNFYFGSGRFIGKYKFNSVGLSYPDYSNFSIFPNPVCSGGVLKFDYKSTNQPKTFRLFDITGRKVFESLLSSTTDNQEIQLPLIQAGLYIVEIKSGVKRSTAKLVVE